MRYSDWTLFLPMYADDMVIFSEVWGRSELKSYWIKWKLWVNVDKSKHVILKKNDKIRSNEKLEKNAQFTYVGIFFNYNKFKEAHKKLSEQAQKAYLLVRKI